MHPDADEESIIRDCVLRVVPDHNLRATMLHLRFAFRGNEYGAQYFVAWREIDAFPTQIECAIDYLFWQVRRCIQGAA